MMVDPIKIATLFIFRVVVRSLCKRQEGAHMPGTSTPRRGATSVSSRPAAAHTASVICGGAGLVVGLGWLIASLVGATAPSVVSRPLYTLAAVRRHLHAGPAGWIGRSVEVRAVATLCATWLSGEGSPCLDQQPRLTDPSDQGSTLSLSVADASAAPLLSALRRLPLVGPLAPSPQPPLLRWVSPGSIRSASSARPVPAMPLRRATRRSCSTPSPRHRTKRTRSCVRPAACRRRRSRAPQAPTA